MIHSFIHNNNENNLPTFSSDLQVNQINQSIWHNINNNNKNSPTCSICLDNLNNNKIIDRIITAF
jgi:hypothetical protein